MRFFIFIPALIFILALSGMTATAAEADEIPKDARAAYTRAHQCFYASGAGAGAGGLENCRKASCAYVGAMAKYKDRPVISQYLRDHYNNVSDQPYETLAASCK